MQKAEKCEHYEIVTVRVIKVQK